MTLEELRKEIDVVDDVLLKAFQERMSLVAQVSQAKQASDLPVLDVSRERRSEERRVGKECGS